MAGGKSVQVTLIVEAGADARERDESTTKLRREILNLNVHTVERPSAGDAPPGTRAIDLAQIGTLLVTLTSTATAVATLVTAVRSWLEARPGGGTVKMQIGGDTLEISGTLSEEQKRLVATWIAAHTGP